MSEAGVAAPFRFGLLGSPNSGKTTLFNALTGLRARVGNYPGVTVERREGRAEIDGRRMVVIDLPGTYSLAAISPDEAIVSRVLAGEVAQVPAPDALIVTMDACSLERSLLLLAQALRQRKPTCLVLTMVDEFRARGGKINLPRLSNALGIPVSAWWDTGASAWTSSAGCWADPRTGYGPTCSRRKGRRIAPPGSIRSCRMSSPPGPGETG